MTQSQEQPSAGSPIVAPIIGNPDAYSGYANSVRVIHSIYDFVLVTAQIEIGLEGDVRLRETAKVCMSPAHAKALAEILTRKVAEYEATFGVLPTQPTQDIPDTQIPED